MSFRRVCHVRLLPVAMAVAAAVAIGACGGNGAADRRSTERAATSKKIVIRAHAELQDVVDKGEVLSGSSLDGAPFCSPGSFSGGHGDTGMIDRTFKCPNGSLRVGFKPGNGSGRTVSARWKVLGGTGAFKGMKGSGRLETTFAPGDQPAEARETYTGTLGR